MLINADCTLYRYDKATGGYTRHFISEVYWRENKAGNVLKSGLQTADSTTVCLYSDDAIPSSPTKDMLVKHSFVTVKSIDNYMFGGLPHIEVSAK